MTPPLDTRDRDALLYLAAQHTELLGVELRDARESIHDLAYARRHLLQARAEIDRVLTLIAQVDGSAV